MWFICAIVTTLIWGIAELLYKKGADPTEPATHLKTSMWVGLCMGAHAAFILLTQNLNYDPVNLIKYLPVSAFYILSMCCAYFGVRYIEVSIASPVENTSGALCTLLTVVFLGETIGWPAAVTIMMMVVGLVGLGHEQNKEIKRPTKKLSKMLAIMGFAMPCIYALMDAFGSFLDIYYLDATRSPLVGITEDNIELIANTTYELTFLIWAILLFIYMKYKHIAIIPGQQTSKILAAICETAGQFTYVYAMSDNGAIAAPIISSVCVVPLVCSRIFLNEKLSTQQYFFIGLIVLGIIILAIIEGE